MIPRALVTAWRRRAPWTDDSLVEQDLVLSRALVDVFSQEVIAEQLAFRGGTALHKLFFDPASRFSEDISARRGAICSISGMASCSLMFNRDSAPA